MSGFFTLARREQEQEEDQHNNNNSSSLFLFRNEEIYDKNFELWQQSYQLNHPQPKQVQDHVDDSLLGSPNPPAGAGNRNRFSTPTEQSLVYNNTHHRVDNINNNNNKSTSGVGMINIRNDNSSSSGTISCQDCGNQAKKDCIYMRCRTCCKSQGFECQTHVKSTWVPAGKRRERHQQLLLLSSPNSIQQQNHQHNQHLTLIRGETPKRPRENPLASTRLPTHISGLEVGHFPAEVNSPAVFRCVKVSAIDETDEAQFAYQTAVNIGGHVFKGLLYDQGPESSNRSTYGVGYESFSGGGGAVQQQVNLISTTGAVTTSTPPGVTWMDSSIYATPLSAFMAGTQFFPPPRS